ncbi:hypothetical protein, partial [uncultured Shimia sp.]|uniref:hypothetical protein n=1 Tax=uncultured Shimia sp. TaxID=573152 RepID=UPI0025FC61CA
MSGSFAQIADPAKLQSISAFHGRSGPQETFNSLPVAALRLPRTSRSCIAQHFPKTSDCNA